MITRTFVITLLLLNAPATCAQIYSWVDSNGQRHYSDKPPANQVNSAYIDIGSPNTIQSVSTNKTQSLSQRQNRQKTKRPATDHSATCTKHRQQIAKLQARLRAGYKEPNGTRMRSKVSHLEQSIRELCPGEYR